MNSTKPTRDLALLKESDLIVIYWLDKYKYFVILDIHDDMQYTVFWLNSYETTLVSRQSMEFYLGLQPGTESCIVLQP